MTKLVRNHSHWGSFYAEVADGRVVGVRPFERDPEPSPLIETLVRLGPVVKRVRLTVANRAGMRFRVIVGRQALARDFVVDVGKTYLLRK